MKKGKPNKIRNESETKVVLITLNRDTNIINKEISGIKNINVF